SHSDDGKAWTQPVVVDDAIDRRPAHGPDSFVPALAVNRDGVVGVTWYDRREDPANRRFRLRFSASFDGGDSFSPSISVSSEAFTYPQPENYQLYSTVRRPPGDGSSFRTFILN